MDATGALVRKMISTVPTKRQLAWSELEYYAFFHYGMNTFTDREWGDGTEPESLFNPQRQDVGQWAEAAKSAGMRGMILTAKHHDGFCLWPSKYTSHSVKNSPYRNGRGDIVMEAARAAAEHGLKFGIYLSPWDRNAASYGDSPAYNTYYKNQLLELLTGYGELFCVWLDGACGEGPNGKKQDYDFSSWYDLIRRYQQNAVISVCGPDVRWCGNEAGTARSAEWSVVPKRLLPGMAAAPELPPLNAQSADLGSRGLLANEGELAWYPAETDTSIRPGWFYHDGDTEKARTAEDLVTLYESTAGANSSLLLNIPPDRRGLLHDNDVHSLALSGRELRRRYTANMLLRAESVTDSFGNSVKQLISDESSLTFWKGPDNGAETSLTVHFSEPVCLSRAVLRENIALSQRIEGVALFTGDSAVPVATAEVVGAKRILSFEPVCSDTFTLRIDRSRSFPTISFFGLYN